MQWYFGDGIKFLYICKISNFLVVFFSFISLQLEKIVYMTSVFLNYSHMLCVAPLASLENDQWMLEDGMCFALDGGSLFISGVH